MLLLMKFFKASAWRNFQSIQLLGSSNQKVFLSRPFGNFGIGISASASSLASALQKNGFCNQNFFSEKIEYLCSFLCLVMVSVPLCCKCLVLYDLLFIQSKASISVLEKSYLNIPKHSPWCFKKATAPKISAYFAYFPAKYPGLTSF